MDAREEHLFVVRIWREARSAIDGDWRGSVEHVNSGTRRYFADYEALDRFIAVKSARIPAASESVGRDDA